MKKRGLIIYLAKNEPIVLKLIKEILTTYRLKNGVIGSITSSGKNDELYRIYQIRGDCFLSYKLFDSFLLDLAEKLDNLEGLGLVVGHNDDTGYFWTDYHFKHPLK